MMRTLTVLPPVMIALALAVPLCPAQYQPPAYPQPYGYPPAYGYPPQPAPMPHYPQPYPPAAYAPQYPPQPYAAQPYPPAQPPYMVSHNTPHGYPQPAWQNPQPAYPPPAWNFPHQTYSLGQAPGQSGMQAMNLGHQKIAGSGKSPTAAVLNVEASEGAVVAGPASNLPNSSERLTFAPRQSTRSNWMRSFWNATTGRLTANDSTKK